MKKQHSLVIQTALIIFLFGSIMISSCTKEGPEGKPGLDGIDGKDGAESCSGCHNLSELLTSKIAQYSKSKHASGINVTQNSATCSRCHTSMGFRNFIKDGTTAIVDNPTPINCRTCHPIHESYTVNDYALRTKEAVALSVGEANYSYNNSNLCANCHQARPISPYPVSGGANITITNARYGPHYGPQANMLSGRGPFQIPGTQPYLNSAHTTAVTNGCVTCHMSTATGIWAGGHQMNVKYTNTAGATAYQYTGCGASGCHSNVTAITTVLAQNRTEIQGLISQLKTRLLQKGLLNDQDLIPVPRTMTQMEAAAVMNYRFIAYDGSSGAHNYRLTRALLLNTLASLN